KGNARQRTSRTGQVDGVVFDIDAEQSIVGAGTSRLRVDAAKGKFAEFVDRVAPNSRFKACGPAAVASAVRDKIHARSGRDISDAIVFDPDGMAQRASARSLFHPCQDPVAAGARSRVRLA